jgi:hypothetical protein
VNLIPQNGKRKYNEVIKDDHRDFSIGISKTLIQPPPVNIINITKQTMVKIPSMTANNPFLKNFIKK